MSRHASLLAVVLLVAACGAPRGSSGPGLADDVPPALDVASDRASDTGLDVAPRPDAPALDAPRLDAPALDAPALDTPALDVPPPDDTTSCPGGDTRCGADCVDPRTSPLHCGGCGRACAASESCAAGVCTALPTDCRTVPCPSGTYCNLSDGLCRPGCLTDPECPQPGTCDATHVCRCATATHRCGDVCLSDVSPASCGTACSPCAALANATATCSGGACGAQCNAGYHRCGAACASDTSLEACGAACTRCPAAPANGTVACTGTCVTQCNPGYHRCGDACLADASPASCGAACSPCVAPTNGVATCTAGACGFTCNVGFHRCGAACVADDSTSQCGASCVACTTAPTNGRAACTAGACGFTCNAGYTRCGSVCVATASDVTNCGGCGVRCGSGRVCNAGVCGCPASASTLCGSTCVDTSTSNTNCGACGTVCPSGAACVGGACACPATASTLCGSTCVDTSSSNANCGACGTVCTSGTVCGAGRCACPMASQAVCGGACVEVQSSAVNCGACGVRCPVACSAGSCATVTQLLLTMDRTIVGTSDGAFYRRETAPTRIDLPVGTTRYVEGDSAACALLDTGAVWCAGDNTFGQLGLGGYAGSPASRATFAPTVGAADAVELWGGGHAFCLRRRSGAVSCWGLNNYGQLGLRPTVCNIYSTIYCRTSPTDSPQFIDARQITFGTVEGHPQLCVVNAAGAVLCTDRGETARTFIPSGASAVEAGSAHQCALMTDGTVRCWGLGVFGQLGNGGLMNAFDTPVTVSGITTAVQIMAGRYHACALLSGGTMQCWGYNTSGEIGDGTIDRRTSPVAVVGLTGVDLLARSVQSSHTCARRTDGSVWCWGSNGFGQLGDGTTINNRFSPVAMRF